jgi:UDP-glucuronate 4-epimerase
MTSPPLAPETSHPPIFKGDLVHILITGVAGFIGSTLALRLLREGHSVTGVDNLNDYYDVSLKEARLKRLSPFKTFHFKKLDVDNREDFLRLFSENTFSVVYHLAAQVGVRYALENPFAYMDSNLTGFGNVLEGCRRSGVVHLIFASSSSVYGGNTRQPFSEHHPTEHPLSLYAATKKANELMAHSYAHIYNLPVTGLRFFTVYGPWGRPDMALFKFTDHILKNKPIPVFGEGKMIRDFTYVDDIVESLVRLMKTPPKGNPQWSGEDPDPAGSRAPYRIFNIGNSNPIPLIRYIEILEDCLGKKAVKEWLPQQPGEMASTFADTSELEKVVGFKPLTSIETGVSNFVNWYREFYRPA